MYYEYVSSNLITNLHIIQQTCASLSLRHIEFDNLHFGHHGHALMNGSGFLAVILAALSTCASVAAPDRCTITDVPLALLTPLCAASLAVDGVARSAAG